MKTKLLLRLADFLDKLPEKRFDYETFVGENWQGKADLSCGTTACALGWATTMPTIRRMGLRLIGGGDIGIVPTKRNGFTPEEIKEKELRIPLVAAAYVFDLSTQEVCYLFYPDQRLYTDGYKQIDVPSSPQGGAKAETVAKHIRRFVAWKQKHGYTLHE